MKIMGLCGILDHGAGGAVSQLGCTIQLRIVYTGKSLDMTLVVVGT